VSTEPCLLCGNEVLAEVRVSLVRYKEPTPGRPFEHLPRCVNREACRARLEKLGEPWPVADTVAELPRVIPPSPAPAP